MPENDMNLEASTGLQEVVKHVKENTVDAKDDKVACSDGRFKAWQSDGGIRLFGGDFGVLAAVVGAAESLGLKLDLKNLVGRYDLFLERPSNNRDSQFHIHTDSHKKGCGHINRIVKETSWGQELYDLVKSDKDTFETVLEGDHKEKGVLFVQSSNKTVNSVDPKTGEQYFVVDMFRAKEYLTNLSDRLAHLNIPGELIWKTYVDQMSATAPLVAAGKEQYEVFLDKPELKVIPQGKISPLA